MSGNRFNTSGQAHNQTAEVVNTWKSYSAYEIKWSERGLGLSGTNQTAGIASFRSIKHQFVFQHDSVDLDVSCTCIEKKSPRVMAPVRSVGIIGAGVSGVAAAVHLKLAGFDVTVFERASTSGGVWVFDERKPPEPPYPSVNASLADFTAVDQTPQIKLRDGEDVLHAPPGPCYNGLRNNVPTPLLEMSISKWRPETQDYVNHSILKDYIQETAAAYDINSLTWFNTRVEDVKEDSGYWHVQTSTLSKTVSGKRTKLLKTWEFDYLVVATGHYHAERVPDTPGLKEWKEARPHQVQHSKSYRHPEEFQNKTVLVVGAGTSSVDIIKEISPFARNIYQSSRGGLFDIPKEALPVNASRIGEILSYNGILDSEDNLPDATGRQTSNSVTLVNGETLHGIDHIILATGYHCSFPFLTQLHRDHLRPQDADEDCLVTDGTQMHNLFHDIFYIPNPTLAFIGVPYFSATFSLFEFQSIAVARIFAGHSSLPSNEDMRREYNEVVQERGFGKSFHSLLGRGGDVVYVDRLVELVNLGQDGKGLPEGLRMVGHSEKWRTARKGFELSIKAAGLTRDQGESNR